MSTFRGEHHGVPTYRKYLGGEMEGKLFRKESPSGMLFGIASVLGLVFTIVYTLVSVYAGNFNLSAISIIITLGIVNGILATICIVLSRDGYNLIGESLSSKFSLVEVERNVEQLTNQLDRERQKLKGVAFHLHNIHDQLRDRIIELNTFYQVLLSDSSYIPEKSDVIDILRITKQFNMYLVNNIKDIFDFLTDDSCSVCIKIIGINDKSEVIVSTLMRDTKSFRERKSKDGLFNEPFLWYENTAFKLILSNDTADSYYVSDNLSKEQSYTNLNNNWRRFYNATLVAPLRINLNDSKFGEDQFLNVIGFVCIDNKKGNFDTRASIEVMASIADSLYQYFNLTGELTDLATTRIRTANTKKTKS